MITRISGSTPFDCAAERIQPSADSVSSASQRVNRVFVRSASLFSSGNETSQPRPHLEELLPSLLHVEGQRKAHLVSARSTLSRRNEHPEAPRGEGCGERSLELGVGATTSRPENERVPVVIEMRSHDTTTIHPDPNRGAFVEIQISADVPEADTQKARPGQGPEPNPLEDAQGHTKGELLQIRGIAGESHL